MCVYALVCVSVCVFACGVYVYMNFTLCVRMFVDMNVHMYKWVVCRWVFVYIPAAVQWL